MLSDLLGVDSGMSQSKSEGESDNISGFVYEMHHDVSESQEVWKPPLVVALNKIREDPGVRPGFWFLASPVSRPGRMSPNIVE